MELKVKFRNLFWGKMTFFERKLLAWGFDVLFVPTLTDLGNSSFFSRRKDSGAYNLGLTLSYKWYNEKFIL